LTFSENSEKFNVSDVVQTAVIVSLVKAIGSITGQDLKMKGKDDKEIKDSYKIVDGKAYKDDAKSTDLPADEDETEFRNALATFEDKAEKIIIQLTLCHMTKKLSSTNIQHYFAGADMTFNSGKSLLPILDYSVSVMANILSNSGSYAMFVDTEFMKYHTTYCSTPFLVIKAKEALGSYAGHFFSKDEMIAVNNAVSSPFDAELSSKISLKVIYTTHAVLKACDKLPENWYQGKRAHDGAPVAPYNMVYSISKRYFEILGQTDVIDATESISRLFGKSGDDMILAPDAKEVEKDNQITSLTRIANKAKTKYVKEAIEDSISKENVKSDLVELGILSTSALKISDA